MLHIDAITGNIDRNYTNIELVVDKDSRVLDVFPMFDNGASLLHDRDISGLYSNNTSIPFRVTHDNQIALIRNLGYRGDIGDKERIISKFKDIKELELLGGYKNTVIEYFIERVYRYGKV